MSEINSNPVSVRYMELMKLWELLNYSCGKRLAAIMPESVAKLECLQDRGNVAGT